MKKPLRTCPIQFCKYSYHCTLSKKSSTVLVFENQISGVKETRCPASPQTLPAGIVLCVVNNRVEIEDEDWSKNIEVKQVLDGLNSINSLLTI